MRDGSLTWWKATMIWMPSIKRHVWTVGAGRGLWGLFGLPCTVIHTVDTLTFICANEYTKIFSIRVYACLCRNCSSKLVRLTFGSEDCFVECNYFCLGFVAGFTLEYILNWLCTLNKFQFDVFALGVGWLVYFDSFLLLEVLSKAGKGLWLWCTKQQDKWFRTGFVNSQDRQTQQKGQSKKMKSPGRQGESHDRQTGTSNKRVWW